MSTANMILLDKVYIYKSKNMDKQYKNILWSIFGVLCLMDELSHAILSIQT